MEEFKVTIITVWNGISQAEINFLNDSMKRRCIAVIQWRGKPTNYCKKRSFSMLIIEEMMLCLEFEVECFVKENFPAKMGYAPFLRKYRGRTPGLFLFTNDLSVRHLLFCVCTVPMFLWIPVCSSNRRARGAIGKIVKNWAEQLPSMTSGNRRLEIYIQILRRHILFCGTVTVTVHRINRSVLGSEGLIVC